MTPWRWPSTPSANPPEGVTRLIVVPASRPTQPAPEHLGRQRRPAAAIDEGGKGCYLRHERRRSVANVEKLSIALTPEMADVLSRAVPPAGSRRRPARSSGRPFGSGSLGAHSPRSASRSCGGCGRRGSPAAPAVSKIGMRSRRKPAAGGASSRGLAARYRGRERCPACAPPMRAAGRLRPSGHGLTSIDSRDRRELSFSISRQ
jgi:hypothetical protein